jgi:hypothetical protein
MVADHVASLFLLNHFARAVDVLLYFLFFTILGFPVSATQLLSLLPTLSASFLTVYLPFSLAVPVCLQVHMPVLCAFSC